jgi:Lantibiotic dehydratase, N terminus
MVARIRLGQGEWLLWDQAVIRSAGFPARGVLSLADEQLAAESDREAESLLGSDFLRSWQERITALSQQLGRIAGSDRFRLALTWQNPHFIDTCLEPFLSRLDAGRERNSRQRTREQVLATYWQRYCVKNDSIGFFGPVAWAAVSRADENVAISPGACLVDRAVVYLERWAVEELAKVIARDPDLDPWLHPRRAPIVGLRPGRVVLADGTVRPVSRLMHFLLTTADGTVPASVVTGQAVTELGLTSEQEAYAGLAELRRRRWLLWRLELPPSTRTEDDLRAWLEGIPSHVRDDAAPKIEELIQVRDRMQAAWHDPARLRAEQVITARIFTELTGQQATRRHGESYAGRTLTYLECRREVSMSLGRSFISRLQPLTLLLTSIRWLTWRIRQKIEPEILACYAALRERGVSRPNAAMLWIQCLPMLHSLDDLVRSALSEFHQRWRSVIAFDDQAPRLHYRSADLERAVAEIFDAPQSGWSEARLCCPDVLIAALSTRDVCAGAFGLVLGDLHIAMNSAEFHAAAGHHPRLQVLLDCLAESFPQPRLLTTLPAENSHRFSVRFHPLLVRRQDYRLALMSHLPPPDQGAFRLAADAAVDAADGRLTVVIDGAQRFDVMDLFAEALKHALVRNFQLFPAEHRPRLTFDDLVVARQSWSVPAAELRFAALATEPRRFIAARQWARNLGIPRFAFVKSPAETKPVYVDFASPVYVEVLAAAVRRALRETRPGSGWLTITEMLPTPDQAWLPDAAGNRYTAECRMTIVDDRREPGEPVA